MVSTRLGYNLSKSRRPPYLFNYIDNYWMNNFVFLLKKLKIQMQVPNYYTTKPQRYNDSYVMNDIIGTLSSKIQL